MAEACARDYSHPLKYDLRTNKPNKTLDIGQNGTTASTDPFGTVGCSLFSLTHRLTSQVLQLGAYHPAHGIILAAPYEQFDKSRYYEPTYVREYRARMLQMIKNGQNGFGIRLATSGQKVGISHQTMDTAVITFQAGNGARVQNTLTVHEDRAFTQNLVIKNPTPSPIDLDFSLNLELSVHRASYGQLTEGGPVPLPACENQLSVVEDGTAFNVVNPLLDAHLAGRLFIDASPTSLFDLQGAVANGILSDACTNHSITVQPDASVTLVAWFKLSPGVQPITPPPRPLFVQAVAQGVGAIWKDADKARTWIIRRNVDYILGNCSLPISGEVVGMITDHVALPLGWNRDN